MSDAGMQFGSEFATPLETSTYQEHVIKHTLGATVLGWCFTSDALHLLLDIGLLWTIYADGDMNLLPQGVALAELEPEQLTAADRDELRADADLLLQQGRDAVGLRRFAGAQVDCLIQSVELFGRNTERKVVIKGENESLIVESSGEASTIRIDEQVL